MSGFLQRLLSLFGVGFFVIAATLFTGGEALARQSLPEDVQAVSSMALAELPLQGQKVYRQILQGFDFPNGKDGSVFGNREHRLPAQRRGYYREYTVRTPGAHNRGARRIICGGQPQTPDACYYTEDHYGSFRRIVP